MTTHCQTAARSRGGERQNLGAVNPFEDKKGDGLFCDIHGIHCMESFEKEFGSVFFYQGAVVCDPQK